MNNPFEALQNKLSKEGEIQRQEGGGIFGLSGVSCLVYFAANAPRPPEVWLEEQPLMMPAPELYAKWAWEYAQAMVKTKPRSQDATSEV